MSERCDSCVRRRRAANSMSVTPLRLPIVCLLVAHIVIAAPNGSQEASAWPERKLALDIFRDWQLDGNTAFLCVKAGTLQPSVSKPGRCIVQAVCGDSFPLRRREGEPFVQLLPGENSSAKRTPSAISKLLTLDAVNAGSRLLEIARGRRLYPFKIRVEHVQWPQTGPSLHKPFAVWNVSSGEILLDTRVLDSIESLPQQVHSVTARFAAALFHQVAVWLPDGTPSIKWAKLFSTAVPSAIAAGFASQIPTWFCIGCPIVLGLLAPFLFNSGLGEAAAAICQHYRLPTEDCNDLWFGAFAVALVLSLASVIPIVYICQLRQCARQG